MNPVRSIASRHISHATPNSSGPATAEPQQGGLGPVGLPKPRPYIVTIRAVKAGSPTNKLVLLTLATWANPATGECWPSLTSLATATELSRSSVCRSLADLESRGHIRRDRTIGGRGDVTTRYKIVILGQTGSTDVKGSHRGTARGPRVGLLGVPGWDTKRSGEESDVQRTNVHSAARATCQNCGNNFPANKNRTCYRCGWDVDEAKAALDALDQRRTRQQTDPEPLSGQRLCDIEADLAGNGWRQARGTWVKF